MRGHGNEQRIDTTLGELIVAVSEAAFEYCEDTREAYALARLALVEIFRNGRHPGRQGNVMSSPGSPRKTYLH